MTILENIKKQFGHLVNPSMELAAASTQGAFSPKQKPQLALPKKPILSSVQSFSETYKTAYTHGLEEIYALENVDLKSVRRIIETHPIKTQAKKNSDSSLLSTQEPQLELDLGEEYMGRMESFLNREPIQILGLSRHAERCLLEHGKLVLSDLVNSDWKDFRFYKGMGQGHLDEIQQKLFKYLDGRPLQKVSKVNFAAWVRSLVAAVDHKKAFVCLEEYNLGYLLSLSPSDSVEVRCLTLEKRREWIEETLELFRTQKRRETVSIDISRVTSIFIKPWMHLRLGIATQSELLEKLERIGEPTAPAASAINFFSATYFDQIFPLSYFLYQVDDELYCADEVVATNYRRIVKRALSYFYKSHICYNLPHFITLLAKDFAQEWLGFPEGFLEKVLRQSSNFRVRKGDKGQLIIRLA